MSSFCCKELLCVNYALSSNALCALLNCRPTPVVRRSAFLPCTRLTSERGERADTDEGKRTAIAATPEAAGLILVIIIIIIISSK